MTTKYISDIVERMCIYEEEKTCFLPTLCSYQFGDKNVCPGMLPKFDRYSVGGVLVWVWVFPLLGYIDAAKDRQFRELN